VRASPLTVGRPHAARPQCLRAQDRS
jgi:hypothetical protein